MAILTAGTGALTLSGNVTIGSDRELVLTNGDGNAARDLTFSGIIGDASAGPSGLTKAGLRSGHPVTGRTPTTASPRISRGRVVLTNTGSLGSTAGGTRIGISGRLTFSRGRHHERSRSFSTTS